MIRGYVRRIIEEEIKAKNSDLNLLRKKVNELQLDINKARNEISFVQYELEKYPKNLEETKDEAEGAIMRMVQDTILKLESYEEAAQAILGRR